MNEPIRGNAPEVQVGVIGLGRAAKHLHVPTLQRLRGVSVAGVAARRSGETTGRSGGMGGVPFHEDYRDLLLDPRIDAILICVPPAMHAPIGVEAIEAGKHVLLEKPLAATLEDCERLVQAARTANVTTRVGFHLRWHRALRAARAAIARGDVGEVALVQTVFTSGVRWSESLPAWRFRRHEGGGALIESGVHHYDLWRFLLTDEVREIYARTTSTELDDVTAVVSGRMERGALVSASFCAATSDSLEIDVFGTKGRLSIRPYALDALRLSPSRRKGLHKIVPWLRSTPSRLGWIGRGALRRGLYPDAYREEWRGFVGAFRSPDAVPSASALPIGASFEDGQEATRIALAAVRAAASGVHVSLAAEGRDDGRAPPS